MINGIDKLCSTKRGAKKTQVHPPIQEMIRDTIRQRIGLPKSGQSELFERVTFKFIGTDIIKTASEGQLNALEETLRNYTNMYLR